MNSRRDFLLKIMGGASVILCPSIFSSKTLDLDKNLNYDDDFKLNYLLATCLYGYADLQMILPELSKLGVSCIDIWPMIHGNQREQLDKIGESSFKKLLEKYNARLGCITQFKLGPFDLLNEMDIASRFGCNLIVTGTTKDDGKCLTGLELKKAIKLFIEKMKPQLEKAEEKGITIAIENHSNLLLNSFDAIKYFFELRTSKMLKVALAPAHLPQDEIAISNLIRYLGDDGLGLFYAWQYGKGFIGTKLSKSDECLQLPGKGDLNFTPMIAALKDINYHGFTEVFMHPTPRGIPIGESIEDVSSKIIMSHEYLNDKCKKLF